MTVRNARLAQMVAEGSAHTGTAAQVQALMRQPTRVVATVQVGDHTGRVRCGGAGSGGARPATVRACSRPLRHVPHPLEVCAVGLTLAAALLTIAVGEIVPRSVALRSPEKVALALAGALRFFMTLFAPLASIALGLSQCRCCARSA